MPTATPGHVHYDALAKYHSYDLAWLGPISFPLALALIGQCFVYANLLRQRCKSASMASKKELIPSGAITAIIMTVMAAETIFGVLCIIQCVVNWRARAFVKGAALCDAQAVYATYYIFAGMSVATFAVVAGAVMRVRGSAPVRAVVAGGITLHLAAVALAFLPYLGHGSYLFAKDFCMADLESPLFTTLALGYYGGCLAAMIAALTWSGCHARAGRTAGRPLALWFATAWFAIAWATVAAVCILYLANGSVYNTPQNGAYAWMGMLLHSNQLVVPLLFGFWWPREVQAAVAARGTSTGLNTAILVAP